jgi:hypothetical protein
VRATVEKPAVPGVVALARKLVITDCVICIPLALWVLGLG